MLAEFLGDLEVTDLGQAALPLRSQDPPSPVPAWAVHRAQLPSVGLGLGLRSGPGTTVYFLSCCPSLPSLWRAPSGSSSSRGGVILLRRRIPLFYYMDVDSAIRLQSWSAQSPTFPKASVGYFGKWGHTPHPRLKNQGLAKVTCELCDCLLVSCSLSR